MPGRTFMRRMYSKFAGIVDYKQKSMRHMWPETANKVSPRLKKYHHVRLDKEFKSDCKAWIEFLGDLSSVSRPFADFDTKVVIQDLMFSSDASKNSKLGFGAVFGTEWTYHKWESKYVERFDPSIQ